MKRIAFLVIALLSYAVAGQAQSGTMLCNPPSEQLGTAPGTCVGTFPDISTAASTIYMLDTSQAPITQNVVTWTTTANPASVSVVVYASSDCATSTSLNTSSSATGSYVFAGTYCWVGVAAPTLSRGVVRARYMGSAGLANDLVGKFLFYNGIATAGWGIPAIYGTGPGRLTGQTGSVATVQTYTPTADGSFEVSANVLVTTATTHSFSVICSYTDEAGSGRNLTLTFGLVAGGTTTTLIANGNGAVPYLGVPVHIRAKANTAITIATSGTFTTVVYNVEGIIRQLA